MRRRLAAAAVRIHAKGIVGQRNGAVFACQVAQAAGHVHMVFLGAVHRLQDAELAIVAAIALAAAVPTVFPPRQLVNWRPSTTASSR